MLIWNLEILSNEQFLFFVDDKQKQIPAITPKKFNLLKLFWLCLNEITSVQFTLINKNKINNKKKFIGLWWSI